MFHPIRCCLAIVTLALTGLTNGRAHAQCAAGAIGVYQYYAGNTSHQTGSTYELDWRVRANIDAPGYLVYGPTTPASASARSAPATISSSTTSPSRPKR